MKAMVLTGIRKMELHEVADPVIQKPNDVLLKLASIGVCGSDVHYYATGRIGSQVVKYPFTVGHECSAIVVKTGPAAKKVKVGDRVAVEPAMSCWECDQCKAGRPHTCRKLRFLGCPGQAEGCLSEYIVMPEECCFPVPASMSFDRAALVEPLSIGYYGVKQSLPMPDAAIGIFGAGPIGLSVLLPARSLGARKIYVTDKIDSRLNVARKAGADWTGNPDRQDIVADISQAEPLLLDVVFECCGEQSAIDQAVDLLKPGGKLMLIGIPTVDRIAITIDKTRRKELCLQNVRRQNHCVPPALDLLLSGRIKADFMITHHFPFERTPEAFDLVEQYQDGVVKAMIHME